MSLMKKPGRIKKSLLLERVK